MSILTSIAPVSTVIRPPTWKLGTLWVLAALSGYLWMVIISWITSQLTDSSLRATLFLVVGILGGAVITAVAQALLINLYVTPFRRLRWIFWTATGYIVGLFVVTLSIYTQLVGISEKMDETILSGMTAIPVEDAQATFLWLLLNITTTTALTGALLGYLQSRVLWFYRSDTKRWVFANMVALPIAVLVFILGVIIGSRRVNEALPWFISASIITVAIIGSITGTTLVHLLQRNAARDELTQEGMA